MSSCSGPMFQLLYVCCVVAGSFSRQHAESESFDKVQSRSYPCGPIPVKIPEDILRSTQSHLGKDCTMRNGKPGKWMINGSLQLGCLPCCKDHYWHRKNNECCKCEEGTTQKEGIYYDCVPKDPSPPKKQGEIDVHVNSTASEEKKDNSVHETVTANLNEIHTQATHSVSQDLRKPPVPRIERLTPRSVEVNWCFFCLYYKRIEIELYTCPDETHPRSFVASASAANHTLNLLLPDTKYWLRMRGFNESHLEKGSWSDGIGFATRPTLEAPLNFNVTSRDGVVTATWKMIKNEATIGKQIWYRSLLNQDPAVIVTFDKTTTSPVEFSLPHDGDYDISLSYIDQDGRNGLWTDIQVLRFLHRKGHQTVTDNRGCRKEIVIAIVATLVCVAVIGLGVGFFFLRKKNETKPSDSDSPSLTYPFLCNVR